MPDKNSSESKLTFTSVCSLAAGGMVGGGIYIALGVVAAISLQWSWLSFLIAGIVALASAHSYIHLANKFESDGGAFEFLEELNMQQVAGSLSWLLIMGYVFTVALYAFAFGHYISFAFGQPPWFTRVLAIAIIGFIVGLNLWGLGKLAMVEIIIVWSNLVILLFISIYGLMHLNVYQLMAGLEPRPVWSSFIGAAAIFVSYEGFQLLTYEYNDIENPKKVLSPAILSSVVFVIFIYCIVALGAVMLAGALTTIEEKKVALAVAAKEGLGLTGLILIVSAAAFATAAAINSTLFSTAKLVNRVAEQAELPMFLEHTNRNNIPDRAVIILGILSSLLAITGTLSMLVEAASLIFLTTFGTVNYIAKKHLDKPSWIPILGMILGGSIGVVLLFRLLVVAPFILGLIILLSLLIIFVRPYILRKVETDERSFSEGTS